MAPKAHSLPRFAAALLLLAAAMVVQLETAAATSSEDLCVTFDQTCSQVHYSLVVGCGTRSYRWVLDRNVISREARIAFVVLLNRGRSLVHTKAVCGETHMCDIYRITVGVKPDFAFVRYP